MLRVATILLGALLIARSASATPPPDSLIPAPLQMSRAVILVRVLQSRPGSSTASVKVLKSWKGPYPAGRVFQVKPPALSASPYVPYVFKAGDRDLLMWLLAVGEGETAYSPETSGYGPLQNRKL